MGPDETKSTVAEGGSGAAVLRPVLVAAALGLLVAAAVFDGLRRERWGRSPDLVAAARRIESVPAEVGAWASTDSPIDRKIIDRAEAAGSVSRTYKNRTTGAEVGVLLLCGRPGPIGAHTPDVCYSGLGFTMAGNEVRKDVTLPDGTVATYWSGRFVKDPGDPGIEVCWAWGTGGNWEASADPRADYFNRPSVDKFYVTRGLPRATASDKPGPDVIREFLTDFLPAAKTALTPTP